MIGGAGDWERLLRFLRHAWELPALTLMRPPRRVTGGYSRRLWLLELAAPERPEAWRVQLRCAGSGTASLAVEMARLQWLTARGYPVPPPVLWVEDRAVLGEPFGLVNWVTGATLAEAIRTAGWRADGGEGRAVGMLLARLHALSPEGFPADSGRGSLLPALSAVAGLIGPSRTTNLRAWFDHHQGPPVDRAPRVCHRDLHPMNVVLSPAGPVVLDWELAAVADPLADVAMTQVLVEATGGTDPFDGTGNPAAYSRYNADVLAAYQTCLPAPEADLRYFRMLAICRRLGDIAGAWQGPAKSAAARADLEAEETAAIRALDLELTTAG
ncbi:MAG: phosphotransferase [Chloroflexota bacterium]|nr:phosphotransferase [Chloroflexota bacterium]